MICSAFLSAGSKERDYAEQYITGCRRAAAPHGTRYSLQFELYRAGRGIWAGWRYRPAARPAFRGFHLGAGAAATCRDAARHLRRRYAWLRPLRTSLALGYLH